MTTLVYKDKTQTATSDTGEDVRKYVDGELVTSEVMNRPLANIEVRTSEIKKHLDTSRHVGLLQESRSVSVVEVKNDGSLGDEGFLSFTKHGGSYFVEPSHFLDPTNSLDYRILIMSSTESGGAFSVERSALYTFYTNAVSSGYNPILGLSEPGQSVSLRVPAYSPTEISASSKKYHTAVSGVSPLRSAIIPAGGFSTWLQGDGVDATTVYPLLKSPSLNTLRIELNSSAVAPYVDTALADYLLSADDDITMALEVVLADTTVHTYALRFSTLEYPATSAGNKWLFTVSTSSYSTILDEQVLDGAGNTLTAAKITVAGVDYIVDHTGISITRIVGRPNPEEELIPLFSHAGDRIHVHGVGSVLIADIDEAAAGNIPIMLRSDGRVFKILDDEVDKRSIQSTLSWATTGETNHEDISGHTHHADLNYIFSTIPVGLPGSSLSDIYRLADIDVRYVGISDVKGVTNDHPKLGVYYILEKDPALTFQQSITAVNDPVGTYGAINRVLSLVNMGVQSGVDLGAVNSKFKVTLPYLLDARTAPELVSGDKLVLLLAHTNVFTSLDGDLKVVITFNYEQV